MAWDSDFLIHLCSVIPVNNAKGKVNPSDSQSAVCIMATHTPALQSKWIHLFVRHLLLLNPEGGKKGFGITMQSDMVCSLRTVMLRTQPKWFFYFKMIEK